MGKLLDQDYLWLHQRPQPQRRRWLWLIPLSLICIAAVWLAVSSTTDTRQPDSSQNTATLDARVGAVDISSVDGGHTYQTVATGAYGGARLIPVSRILTTSPGDDIQRDIDTIDPTANSPAPSTNRPAHAPATSLTPPRPGWINVHVASGDTLSLAFNRYHLSYMDSLQIAHLHKYGKQFTRELKGGDVLQVKADDQGRVLALDYPTDALHTLQVRRAGDSFTAELAMVDVEHRRAYATGVIDASFYGDGRAAGLTDSQILALYHIFSWDIDFAQDIQPGDRFVVVYDELYRDGHKLANGDILAAAFINQGHAYRAFRYTTSDGDTHYYTASGRPMKQAFVRAPVDYTRISSPFSTSRYHPILHRIRRHEGTDYAAPMGTPIEATADGTIIFKGRRGGYGNMVIVRHDKDITMRFGHMSRFSSHFGVGSTVRQGDVIGYVGMTGLATGPHVHYEIRVDGTPRNPQTIKLPGAPPLSHHSLIAFKAKTQPLLARLNDLSHTSVAQLEDASATLGN